MPKYFSLRLQGHDKLDTLEELTAKFKIVENGIICLVGVSKSQRIAVQVYLVFPEERIEFNPENMFLINDDGSSEIMKESEDIYRFLKALYLNGKIELWSLDEKLLGRCNPYIPVNIDPKRTVEKFNRLVHECQEEAQKRVLDEDR